MMTVPEAKRPRVATLTVAAALASIALAGCVPGPGPGSAERDAAAAVRAALDSADPEIVGVDTEASRSTISWNLVVEVEVTEDPMSGATLATILSAAADAGGDDLFVDLHLSATSEAGGVDLAAAASELGLDAEVAPGVLSVTWAQVEAFG